MELSKSIIELIFFTPKEDPSLLGLIIAGKNSFSLSKSFKFDIEICKNLGVLRLSAPNIRFV